LPEQVFVVKHPPERLFYEQVFDLEGEHLYALSMSEALTPRQREILNVISTSLPSGKSVRQSASTPPPRFITT
jgi:hypothetical protein